MPLLHGCGAQASARSLQPPQGGRSKGVRRAPGQGGEDVQKQGGGGQCRERLAKPDLGNRCDKTGPGVTSRAKGPLGTLIFLEGEKLRDSYFQKNALLEKK